MCLVLSSSLYSEKMSFVTLFRNTHLGLKLETAKFIWNCLEWIIIRCSRSYSGSGGFGIGVVLIS